MSRKSKAAPVAEQEEVKTDVTSEEQSKDVAGDNQEAQTEETTQHAETQAEAEKSETSEPEKEKIAFTIETGGMPLDQAVEVVEQIKQQIEESKC